MNIILYNSLVFAEIQLFCVGETVGCILKFDKQHIQMIK